jgi:pimeloyl-ACP methyl ester carboxylesterase
MAIHALREGAGEPLVLVHGTGGDAAIWRPLLGTLGQHCDVLAVDLPGFGRSPLLDRPLTPTVLAAAVAEAMEAAGWSDAHVVGHSLGGQVAVELAAAGRARSMVLLSPSGMATRWEWAYVRAVLRLHRGLGRVVRRAIPLLARSAVLRTILLSIPGSRPWRWPPEETARIARAFIDAPGFRSVLAHQPHRVPAARLAAVECPTLVLWGTVDLLLPLWQARRWAQALPHAEVRPLPRLGHAPIVDAPDVLADAILRFVDDPPRIRGGSSTNRV